jgi:NAD(P)-dependent dehydrogenase (short-subunit alcohol dehydrogenase family)
MVTNFKGQVVMITGGAGNLGRAVAHKFASLGAKLVLVDSKLAYLESAKEALGDVLVRGRYLLASGDLANPKDVERIVAKAEKRFGKVNALVHTVGGFTMGDPVHTADVGVFERMMTLNAQTVFVTCGRVARHMVEHGGGGSIVVVLARAGLKGAKHMAAYTASKAAAERIVQAMAEELKDHSIRVNGVMPSTIDTPANRRDMPNADTSRWVTPQQLADVIAFLSSDEASAITGDSIGVYHKA